MKRAVERLAVGSVLAGLLWLAWITPDELLALLLAAATHPAVWLNAGAAAAWLLAATLLWRALRYLTARRGRVRV